MENHSGTSEPGADHRTRPRAPAEPQRDPVAQAQAAWEQLCALAGPMCDAIVRLVVLQVRYARLVVIESLRVTLAKVIVAAHIWALSLAGWLFLNVAVWRAAGVLDPLGIAQAFAVVALQALGVAALVTYYRKLRESTNDPAA